MRQPFPLRWSTALRHFLGWALAFFFCASPFCGAAPPELEPRDVSIKLKEVLRHHATYKKLDRVLAKRSLENFIEELDPSRTYLTQLEVEQWLDPSSELVDEVLRGYDRHDYHHFADIYNQMAEAIERRNRLEMTLPPVDQQGPPPDLKEFKNPAWAKDEEELRHRLSRLRVLQIEASQKLEPGSATLALERLQKRRHRHEAKILGETSLDRRRLVLATVLKATASALDSQTAYFTPEEATDFINQLQKRLYGIGVQMRDDLNGFKVVRIVEGGPAYVQGKLRNGDLIVGVNGEPVVGLDILDVVQLVRGPEGTAVDLKVIRTHPADSAKPEETLDINVVRGEVVLKETRIEVETEPFGDAVIGRVALYSFYQDHRNSSASDLKEAILDLKAKHNLQGLILDLRQNAGGLLPQAVDVAGLFITRGVVVSIRDSDGQIHHLRNDHGEQVYNGPLVVLTSRASASASEIVAGCLQDYGRALVVGDPTTYGKGTFQTSTIDTLAGTYVNPKGEFKVTRGTYHTVSGESPQLVGIEADVVVPGPYSELELGEKFSKYPLQNDQIKPSFFDDLSDLSLARRIDALRDYRHQVQQRLTVYTDCLPVLRDNSKGRLAENKDYQFFLSVLRGEAEDDESHISRNDFQLIEAFTIMKDLIVLTQQPMRKAA